MNKVITKGSGYKTRTIKFNGRKVKVYRVARQDNK